MHHTKLILLLIAGAILFFQGCDITNPLDSFQLILDVPVTEDILPDQTMTGQTPSNAILAQNVHLTGGTMKGVGVGAAPYEMHPNVSGWVRLVGTFENTGVSAVTVSIHTGPAGGGPVVELGTLSLSSFGATGTLNVEASLTTSQSVYLSVSGTGPVDVLVHTLTLYLPAQTVISKDVTVDDLEDYDITSVADTKVTGTLTNLSGVVVEVYLLFHTSASMNRDEHSIFETTIAASSSLDLSTTNPDVTGINAAITAKQDLYFEIWLVAADNISSLNVEISSLAFNATVRASTAL